MEDNVPSSRIYRSITPPILKTLNTTLLSDILAGGKNSRLYQRLVYDEQIATSVSGFNMRVTLQANLW